MVALAATLWGMWPLVLAKAGSVSSSFQGLFVMFFMTVFAFPFLRWDRNPGKKSRRAWAGVVWLGIADSLNLLFLFRAYQLTSVAIAVLTHYLAPILIAVASPWVLREKMSSRAKVAVALSFTGIFVVLSPWSHSPARGDLLGATFGAMSAVCYASNVLVQKKIGNEFTGTELMAYHSWFGLPIFLFLSPFAVPVPWHACAWLLLGALVMGTLGGMLFLFGLKRIPANHAATLTLLEPLVAVVAGGVFLHQPLSPNVWLGGSLVLLGSWQVIRS